MHAWQWVSRQYPELLIFHVPNGEARDIATAIKLKRMGVVPGVADFLMFIKQMNIAIELKEFGGMQSDAQRIFQHRWEQTGGIYELARSLDEFKGIVQHYALLALS